MTTLLGLLPSPLLGPSAWQSVADDLIRRGWEVAMPQAADAAPSTADDVLRSFLAALPADREVVLVPHSNAGLYAPALVERRRVVGYVFVDAGLPDRAGRVPLAPAQFYELLELKAGVDGLLPPWTQWWDDVAPLFPDAASRERVEREQRRLPLSYFAGSVPVPQGWDDRPGAYLAFGDTYAQEREDAARRGWPVVTLPGLHLHTLVRPDQVAAEIDALLATIGIR